MYIYGWYLEGKTLAIQFFFEILSLYAHCHDLAVTTFSCLEFTVEAVDHNPEVDAERWKDFIQIQRSLLPN